MKQYVCLFAERIDAKRKKILITIKSRTEMKKNVIKVYTPADWFHADKVFVDCYTCTQKKGRNFETSRFCNKPM